jgi:SAM-dependent methyltransferase
VTTEPIPSLGERYAAHNRARGRGFVYGGADRTGEIARATGDIADGVILDLGCRDGSLARALVLPRGRTVGVDIDHEALAAATDAVLACRGDLWRGFPFADDAFALVVAGEIVEHVPFPESLVAEVARVLRPGGRVVGSVPNAFRLKNRIAFARGRWFEADPTHLRQFSPSSLEALLRGAGFGSITVRPCVGRYARTWPRMLANDLVWSGTKR